MTKKPESGAENSKTAKKESLNEITSTSYSFLIITILTFIVALLLGILIQQNIQGKQDDNESSLNQAFIEEVLETARRNGEKKVDDKQALFDMEAAFNQMSENLKKEILEAVRGMNQDKKSEKQDDIINEPTTSTTSTTPRPTTTTVKTTTAPTKPPKNVKIEQPKSKNEPTKVTIGDETINDNSGELKFKPGEQPIVIDPSKAAKKEEKQAEKKPKTAPKSNDINSFQSTIISKIKPKKMWIPIPNSNGGHRRCPAIEINAGKEHRSSVKVWLYEEFLSKEECQQLIEAHESHLAEMKKQKPIICFDSLATLKKNLIELKREKFAELVSEDDFTEGTLCLNQTFSRQLEKWGLKWSYSTAFYPGESKFSTRFGKLIQEATQLEESHGGKYQITSYPPGVGYKSHTDCTLNSEEARDRYATFLVYLNDLGADGGGETTFPELGIDVKPHEGRALTWNSMNYETGKCEPASIHEAGKVTHEVKKKYVIQRWYYYKNFYALGKRMQEPELPERAPHTPKVSCDEYDFGSCRMYDEWNMDHVIEYLRDKNKTH